MGFKFKNLRTALTVISVVVGFGVLVGLVVYLLNEEPDLNMTKAHYKQLSSVASYFEPYCGDDYRLKFREFSEGGLSPNEVLDLLGISPKTYSFYRTKDSFLLGKLNCVGWDGGPFDAAGYLDELNDEIGRQMYRRVDKFVGTIDSTELKRLVEDMSEKGYLSLLDFYLIEVRYKDLQNERTMLGFR